MQYYPKKVTSLRILAVRYSPTTLQIERFSSFENVQWTHNKNSVFWLDISDYEEIEELHPLEENLRLHPLALEDCVNVRQRPKVDDYSENLFLISRMVSEKNGKYAEGPQLGIFLGEDFVVTIHRELLPTLNDILKDLEKRKPQLIESSASFLLYAILDAVVDNLQDAVKKAEETETVLGDEVLKEPPPEDVLRLIYTNRRNLLLVRRLLRPQSDVVHCLARESWGQIVNQGTEVFIRDIYDHTLRTLDRIDNLLDINMGSLNIYSSSFSNRINETMRFLAVISTIGVPLTILVGWYGMNFQVMPEVYWTYGYLIVILLAIAIVTATVLMFKRKRWL